MRNKDRIKPFCMRLAEIWEDNFPDWRFGQLMFNYLLWLQKETKTDGFYIEDGEMMALLEKYKENYPRQRQ